MEISEKLTKIVNGYMRMQYGIMLRTLATTTRIVNERRKSGCAVIESEISLFTCSNLLGKCVSCETKSYDVLSDTKPNPPIA